MAQLSQGNLDQAQLRQAFTTLVQSVSSSSQLYQPAITKRYTISLYSTTRYKIDHFFNINVLI